MTVKVLKVNDGEGQVLLTYKRLVAEKGNERLKEAFENKEVLKAPVTQILGGGLSVVVDEARVFIPASLVSDTYEKDLSKYKDQEIEFVISEFNPRRNRRKADWVNDYDDLSNSKPSAVPPNISYPAFDNPTTAEK